jgi:hypothetical protein
MRTILALVGLLVLTTQSFAADKALMLNDDEQTALRQILDVATRAQGLQIAPTALYFINKINAAPSVVPHKDDAPKAEEPKKNDGTATPKDPAQ